jgi:hypothetical protein
MQSESIRNRYTDIHGKTPSSPVSLAIELAESLGETDRVRRLLPQRDLLSLIKLDKEDTLCNEDMREGMRNLRRDRRPTAAAHRNLVCDMELKHLRYTPTTDRT